MTLGLRCSELDFESGRSPRPFETNSGCFGIAAVDAPSSGMDDVERGPESCGGEGRDADGRDGSKLAGISGIAGMLLRSSARKASFANTLEQQKGGTCGGCGRV